MKGCFFDKSLWCSATGTFSNGQIQICLFCGINKRTSLKSIWCGSEGRNCCLQSKHIAIPPPVQFLLIITSILDMKWRKKKHDFAIQVTFRVVWVFESCQTSVFHLQSQPIRRKNRNRMRGRDSIRSLEMEKVKIVRWLCDFFSLSLSLFKVKDVYLIKY